MKNLLGIEITNKQFDYFMNEQSKGKKLKVVNGKIVVNNYISIDEEIKQLKLMLSIDRMEEIRKDFEQDRLGLVVPDLEDKKVEYIQLLQEVRALQGKEPRKIK